MANNEIDYSHIGANNSENQRKTTMNDPKEVCICIKNDEHGESACRDASCDPAVWGFVCHNECVVEMTKRLQREEEARIAAEETLKKYRAAIKPFVNNCRAVIEAVDGKGGEP